MFRLYLLILIWTMLFSCGLTTATEKPHLPEESPPEENEDILEEVEGNGDIEAEEEEETSIPIILDRIPPVLLESYYDGENNLHLVFDETVTLDSQSPALDPQDSPWELTELDNQLIFTWIEQPPPAQFYSLSITVKDSLGNSNWFILPLWSPNPDRATILLNETNPKGSGNNPDTLEFYCTSPGSLKGLTVKLGTESINNGEYIFPHLMVQQGDYIILHCKPQEVDEEKDEIDGDKTQSGGLLASHQAWDLWAEGGLPLAGTSGVISLYSLPLDGTIMDCLVYTNRQDDSDDSYLGWTSSVYKQVADLPEGAWLSSGAIPMPSEAVWAHSSTGTRSLCRDSASQDSDSSSDWHTVPTGQKSFGTVNSDEIYEPN